MGSQALRLLTPRSPTSSVQAAARGRGQVRRRSRWTNRLSLSWSRSSEDLPQEQLVQQQLLQRALPHLLLYNLPFLKAASTPYLKTILPLLLLPLFQVGLQRLTSYFLTSYNLKDFWTSNFPTFKVFPEKLHTCQVCKGQGAAGKEGRRWVAERVFFLWWINHYFCLKSEARTCPPIDHAVPLCCLLLHRGQPGLHGGRWQG